MQKTGLGPNLGEADPGGLGASPQEINSLIVLCFPRAVRDVEYIKNACDLKGPTISCIIPERLESLSKSRDMCIM
jgi:hypothetical protein